MRNWKTTIAGALTIVAAVSAEALKYFDGDPLTNPDLTVVLAAVIAGVGLIAAKDHNVSGGGGSR